MNKNNISTKLDDIDIKLLFDNLRKVAKIVFPRIMTQICRDPFSPNFGSCDRNWWHYKTIDFPSIILQQASHTLAIASTIKDYEKISKQLQEISRAGAKFWNIRAVRYGAFEEYYPYERGYPPLAFSTLSIAHLCLEKILPFTEVLPGLEKATNQLLNRFESKASNQQVAGIAALSIIKHIAPNLVPKKTFDILLDRTLELQTNEGWFPEYDGPDLGYLSVTLDCLWDLYDVTSDERVFNSIKNAFNFLAWLVLDSIGNAGMHNSRNTDYIVPYGIARLSTLDGPIAYRAQEVLNKIYQSPVNSYFQHNSIDDRYWCHYIGTSLFRSIITLGKKRKNNTFSSIHNHNNSKVFNKSGYAWCQSNTPLSPNIFISTRKGSICTIIWPDGQRTNDFGWNIISNDKMYVSHWWTKNWEVKLGPDEFGCDGWFVPVIVHTSRTWKHIVLRLASLILGQKIIPILKRMIIFKNTNYKYKFRRRINKRGNLIIIDDIITGINNEDKICRAARFSQRHVASANTFHFEDLSLSNEKYRNEVIERSAGVYRVITTYINN
jgi:hypothetical protein